MQLIIEQSRSAIWVAKAEKVLSQPSVSFLTFQQLIKDASRKNQKASPLLKDLKATEERFVMWDESFENMRDSGHLDFAKLATMDPQTFNFV